MSKYMSSKDVIRYLVRARAAVPVHSAYRVMAVEEKK
jgi:hypothetical protein